MNDENLTTHFETFLNDISDQSAQDRLFYSSALLELLRHTKKHSTSLAIASLLASLPEYAWDSIPFSFTKTLLSDGYKNRVRQCGVPETLVDDVLLSALVMFLDALDTKQPTEDLLKSMVTTIAKSVGEDMAAEDKPPPAKPPELFNHWLVKRALTPSPVTDEVLRALGAKLVYFSAPINSKHNGPEIRGLAFDIEDKYLVVLESGELVDVPKTHEGLRIVNAEVLAPDVPNALFLSLMVAAPELEKYGVISSEQLQYVTDGSLGTLHCEHTNCLVSADDITVLEHVFDMGRESATIGVTGATGPVGAIVRFPVPGTDMHVVLDANQDAHGPYSTARLVRENATGTDTVLMRHETPRLYSLRGVYLFPLKDRLISLTVIF